MRALLLIIICLNCFLLSSQRRYYSIGRYEQSEEQYQLVKSLNKALDIDSFIVTEYSKYEDEGLQQKHKRTFYLNTYGTLDSLKGDEIDMRFRYDEHSNINMISVFNKTIYKFSQDTIRNYLNYYDSSGRLIGRTSSDTSSTIEMNYGKNITIETIAYPDPKTVLDCVICIYNFNNFFHYIGRGNRKNLFTYNNSGYLEKKTMIANGKYFHPDTTETCYYYNSKNQLIDEYHYNIFNTKRQVNYTKTYSYNIWGRLKKIAIESSSVGRAEVNIHSRKVIANTFEYSTNGKSKKLLFKMVFDIYRH